MPLEFNQGLQISEFAIFSLRINLFHGCQTLRVTDVTRQGDAARGAVFDACVVQIAQRAAPTGGAAGVTERPGLKYAAAAIPEIIRVAKAKRVELARYRNLRMRPQDQRPEAVLRVHHVKEREARIRTGRG